MSQQSLLYLSRQDVEEINLPMIKIIDALEAMFFEKGNNKVEMPPKPGIHTEKDSFIHAMPAYIPSLGAAGMKWISGYPSNQAKGLPYITGLLILNDPRTGFPLAVMDATWITAKRTGAATAVAAKKLARVNSSTVGIIACGVQGRSNLEALASVFKIKNVKAYDLYPEVAKSFSRNMEQTLGVEIKIVDHPRKCMVSDIVVTSGPILREPNPVIKSGWLPQGAFASAVDFDSYWQGSALFEVDKIATDDIDQMEYYRKEGYFKETPKAYADLGDILVGRKPGRENDHERTFCINLGIALDDVATAIMIYRVARKRGIGRQLPF